MVISTSQRMSETSQELLSQRKKTKSPTIEDDFTIDEEEPFDEPRSTPRSETKKAEAKVTFGENKRGSNGVDAELDMLCWTRSDLDGAKDDCADKSKSVHSLVWSASELDDTESFNTARNSSMEQRDDIGEDRESIGCRERSTNLAERELQSSTAEIKEKQARSSSVQFNVKKQNKMQSNMAVRTQRSIDDDESNVFDEVSAFSVTPSVAPSVAVSVTKRTRNTKTPNPKSPRTPGRTTPRIEENSTVLGEGSVLTADIIAEAGGGCSMRKIKAKDDGEEEEDILDRFFENVEDKVCKSSQRRKKKKKEDGLTRLIINPFLERLEKFDCVFEQLEELACPEDKNKAKNGKGAAPSTPAAFAADAFSQLLDQIEKFDPGFKSKAASCQQNCDIYGQNGGGSSSDEEDDASESSSVQKKDTDVSNQHCESLKKAYEHAEKMVKEQNQTSHEETDQLKTMKEQWYTARKNWKLRQAILAEVVKQNTAKAVDSIVSSCHPEMSSESVVGETENAQTTPVQDENAEDQDVSHPLDVITEEINDSENTEPTEKTSSAIPSTPKEWFDMWKTTVDAVSEKILDRAQCASASINVTESTSYEEIHDQDNKAQTDGHHRSHRMNNRNSIVENDEDQSVSVIMVETESNDNDDLSGFETAANEMDFVHDERPPMLRLIKSRTESRSIGSGERSREGSRVGLGSIQSISKSGSVQSRLSSEVPESYTLADSIRHASLSDRTKDANRTRKSKEPRGNKSNIDASSHFRVGSLPPVAPPSLPKLDPESISKDHHQEQIKSPKSSETNETSDLTAVTASSSDVVVTEMNESTDANRPVVVKVENSKTKESKNDAAATENILEASNSDFVPNPEPLPDDDGDKGTVFSYNTTSTGSTEFKDCYEDAIPSMSTMVTAYDDDASSFSRQKIARTEQPSKKLPSSLCLASNEDIVKSMAFLSVSATVLKTAGNAIIEESPEEYEVESVPSTSTYPQEDTTENSILKERNEELPEELFEKSQSNDFLRTEEAGKYSDQNSMIEKGNEHMSEEFQEKRNPGDALDATATNEEPCIEEEKEEESESAVVRQNMLENDEKDCIVEQEHSAELNVGDFPISKKSLFGSLSEADSGETASIGEGDASIEDNIDIDNALKDEGIVFNSEELIVLKSLQEKDSIKNVDQMVVVEAPKQDQDAFFTTMTTKKASSKLREPRTLEDRRRRRLRQRRKFEKVLRGEDDSSSMSSSTMSGQSQVEDPTAGEIDADTPLISASFDTGFGSIPVVEEPQF